MRRYGLIGYPLTHSFSEKYFAEKFAKEGINDAIYQNFQISQISEIAGLLEKYPDLLGFNVTIPHKENILPLLSSQSSVVRDIGACNCVRIHGKSLAGHNTDVIGFEKSIRNFLKDFSIKALILGTGGSSKAVAFVLHNLGIEFMLVSRKSVENGLTYEELNEQLIKEYRLIINTTPLGMYPVEKYPEIPYEYLSSAHYLYDLIYNPSKTVFLAKGEVMGARIKNGHEMLEIQAEESWRIWNE